MNKQQIGDNIMHRVEVLADRRKTKNDRENMVMVLYITGLIGVLALMIYLFRKEKFEGLMNVLHTESIPITTAAYNQYLPLFLAVAGLSLLAFIGYAIRVIINRQAADINIAAI